MKGYRELNENLKNQNNQCLKGTDAYFYQNPLDLFKDNNPSNNKFCEIYAADVLDETEKDSKILFAKSVSFKKEIQLPELIKEGIKCVYNKVKNHLSSIIDHSCLSTKEDYTDIISIGECSSASVVGK